MKKKSILLLPNSLLTIIGEDVMVFMAMVVVLEELSTHDGEEQHVPLPLERGCCIRGTLVDLGMPIEVVELTTFACLNNLSI